MTSFAHPTVNRVFGCVPLQVVLPALVQLLVPAVRPVAANLQSVEERDTLAALVDTMLAYNLRYGATSGTLHSTDPIESWLCCNIAVRHLPSLPHGIVDHASRPLFRRLRCCACIQALQP